MPSVPVVPVAINQMKYFDLCFNQYQLMIGLNCVCVRAVRVFVCFKWFENQLTEVDFSDLFHLIKMIKYHLVVHRPWDLLEEELRNKEIKIYFEYTNRYALKLIQSNKWPKWSNQIILALYAYELEKFVGFF